MSQSTTAQRPAVSPSARRGRRAPALLGLIAGVAAYGLLVVAPGASLLRGLVAVCLIVLLPSAPGLSLRVAINCAIALGWTPLVMWLPPQGLPGGRSATVLAIGVGVLAARAAADPKALRMEVRPRDGWVLAAAVGSVAVASPLLRPGSPVQALSMLTLGWDHASHFSMYQEQRLQDRAPPFLSHAGEPSIFDNYPQTFHSLQAVVADLVSGAAGDTGSELMSYASATALIYVVAAVLVVSTAMQSLPDDCDRLVTGLVALSALLLVLGFSGGVNLFQGHLNFLLAAVSPALIVLLGRPGWSTSAWHVGAMWGLLIVASGWLIAFPTAVVAASVAVLTDGAVRRGRPGVAGVAVGLAASALMAFNATRPVRQSLADTASGLTQDGPVPEVRLWVLVPVLVVAIALLVRIWIAQRVGPGHLVVASTSVCVLVSVGALQLTTTGELSYYFWKTALATTLIVTILAADQMAQHPRARLPADRPLSWVAAAAVVSTLAIGFGAATHDVATPSATWTVLTPRVLTDRAHDATQAEVVLKAASMLPAQRADRTTLVASRPRDLNADYANSWMHTLGRSRTQHATILANPLFDLGEDPRPSEAAAGQVVALALKAGNQVLVTDPCLWNVLQTSLDPGELESVRLVAGEPASCE